MAKSLEEFRATKNIVVKDKSWCDEWAIGQESQQIAEYEGGCFIFLYLNAPCMLVIANETWTDSDISQLETVLYDEWYLREIASD